MTTQPQDEHQTHHEDMQVRNVAWEAWGDENDPTSNWQLAQQHATFSHREECEFIFYVGSLFEESEDPYWKLNEWKALGFSQELLQEMLNTQNMGFKYLCIYA